MTTVVKGSSLAALAKPPAEVEALPGWVAALRRELLDALVAVTQVDVPKEPISDTKRSDCRVRVWHEGATLAVLTAGDPGDWSIHVASRPASGGWPVIQTLPDWTAISPGEALDIAAGLLAAVRSLGGAS